MTTKSGPASEVGASGMGIGTKVFLILAALTVVEYAVAIAKPVGQIALILAIAVAKATLIVIYFMHIGALRRERHT